jgi:hypothetical protein
MRRALCYPPSLRVASALLCFICCALPFIAAAQPAPASNRQLMPAAGNSPEISISRNGATGKTSVSSAVGIVTKPCGRVTRIDLANSDARPAEAALISSAQATGAALELIGAKCASDGTATADTVQIAPIAAQIDFCKVAVPGGGKHPECKK